MPPSAPPVKSGADASRRPGVLSRCPNRSGIPAGPYICRPHFRVGNILDALKDHIIHFSGLKDGEHAFSFMLGQEFFQAAAEEEWLGGDVTATVRLDKSPIMLVTHMQLAGTVEVRCDRCDTPFGLPVSGDQRQIFHLTETEPFDDDELVALGPSAHSVELTHYFYECLRLALPARHVHAPGQCDPAAEAVLGRLSVEHPTGPDPRWAALDNLKNQRP